jgi:zinc/manganese transport system substrate-binding protein
MNRSHYLRVCLLLVCFGHLTVAIAASRLNVIATTPDIAAITRVIGGDQVEVTTLARPTEDAHFVDPKPSFIVKLNRADVLIEGGAELESAWLGSLLQGARNPKLALGAPGRIRCNVGIAMREVPSQADRSQGDIHAAGNPHFLIAPTNARLVAHNIGQGLAQLLPDQRAAIEQRVGQFQAQLDAKLKEWKTTLAPFAGQPVVAYHNSWPYFGAEFGLQFDLFLEPKPGIPPSSAHLASLITAMRERKVQVIFQDPYVSRKAAETVAQNTGAKIVPVCQFPGGIKGTEGGYVELLDYLVSALAKAFSTRP